MAKIVIQHEADPSIGIVLQEVPPGTPGRARGWMGVCTECGFPLHRWERDNAIAGAQKHVDGHESSL